MAQLKIKKHQVIEISSEQAKKIIDIWKDDKYPYDYKIITGNSMLAFTKNEIDFVDASPYSELSSASKPNKYEDMWKTTDEEYDAQREAIRKGTEWLKEKGLIRKYETLID